MSLATTPVGRVAVISDSQCVIRAQQLIDAGNAAGLLFDFVAAENGIGLADLDDLLERVSDTRVANQYFEAILVNLGVNDIGEYDANWQAFFAGTYPAIGASSGMPYADRVQELLDALPEATPIYWIGVPQGLPTSPCHPWEIAAVDITLANFDPLYSPGDGDERFHYHDPDAPTDGISPKFADAVHYSPSAASALFGSVCARIASDLS